MKPPRPIHPYGHGQLSRTRAAAVIAASTAACVLVSFAVVVLVLWLIG